MSPPSSLLNHIHHTPSNPIYSLHLSLRPKLFRGQKLHSSPLNQSYNIKSEKQIYTCPPLTFSSSQLVLQFLFTMPGTILVSVMEFMGLPSSLPFSSISIKVSMGKREYQTWEKGDFSFPLTTLHDNLIVLLQDAEGNEISHAGVETKSIVEKGLWDDLFPLEGGGQVHMKLQFVLNEDERNRIRLMRESALNKKHQELFESKNKNLQSVSTAGSNAASSLCLNHEISDRNEETSTAIHMSQRIDVHLTKLSHRELHEKAQSLSANNPTGSISSEVAAFSFGSSELAVPSTNPESLLDGITEDLEKLGLRKKASNSVREMISVFESSLAQETRSHMIPPSAKLQTTKVGLYLQEPEVNNVRRAHSTGQLEELSTIKVRNKGTNISPKNKVDLLYKGLDRKEEKSRGDLMGTSTLETSSAADMIGNQLRRQHYNLFSSKQDSGGKVVSSKHAKRWNIEGALAHKLDPVASYEDMLSSFEESGAWILPDQARRFCLTTGGKKLMDLLGGHSIKPNIHEAKMNISVPDTEVEPTGDGGSGTEVNSKKKTHQAKKSKPKIENVETSEGPLGQVIKVAIMVGFGTLVLLTRQRNYR